MATRKTIPDPGVHWSSLGYGQAPDILTNGVWNDPSSPSPTSWGFLPLLAQQLGYSPALQMVNGDAQPDNQSQIDAAAQWLQSQGLTPRSGQLGNSQYGGVFDKDGNLVASQGFDTGAAARGDLLGMAKWLGIPAAAVPALSAALGSAAAPAAASSADITGLLGPQGLDAVNGMSPLYASGAAPAGITAGVDSLAPVTMADMNAAAGLSATGGLIPGSEMAAALGGLAPIAALSNVAPISTATVDTLPPVTQAAMNAAGGVGAGIGLSDIVGALGGAKGVGAALGGLLGAAAGPQGDKTTVSKTLDPRMDSMVYGDGGYLPAVQSWFNANKDGNPNMLAGANALQSLYSSPAIAQGYQSMANAGQQMMSGNGGSAFLQGLLSAGPQRTGSVVPYTNVPAPVSIGGGAALPWMKFQGQ